MEIKSFRLCTEQPQVPETINHFLLETSQFANFGQQDQTMGWQRPVTVTGFWTLHNFNSLSVYTLAKYIKEHMGNIYPRLPQQPGFAGVSWVSGVIVGAYTMPPNNESISPLLAPHISGFMHEPSHFQTNTFRLFSVSQTGPAGSQELPYPSMLGLIWGI